MQRPLPFGHPDFGRAFPCQHCHGSEPPEERAARLWRLSGIADAERARCTFDGFQVAANPTMHEAYSTALAWADHTGPPFLVLAGDIGTGKTHLAVAAAQLCLARGDVTLYLVVPDWLDALRATQRHRPYSEGDDPDTRLETLLHRAQTYPVVVFDDLGADRQTDFAREQLYKALNARWRYERRTLITTNEDAGHFDERLQSRMQDSRLSRVIGCRGKDMRREPR